MQYYIGLVNALCGIGIVPGRLLLLHGIVCQREQFRHRGSCVRLHVAAAAQEQATGQLLCEKPEPGSSGMGVGRQER